MVLTSCLCWLTQHGTRMTVLGCVSYSSRAPVSPASCVESAGFPISTLCLGSLFILPISQTAVGCGQVEVPGLSFLPAHSWTNRAGKVDSWVAIQCPLPGGGAGRRLYHTQLFQTLNSDFLHYWMTQVDH